VDVIYHCEMITAQKWPVILPHERAHAVSR